MKSIFDIAKENTDKQELIIEMSRNYNISQFVLDNFTLSELEAMDDSILQDPWLWYSKDKGFTLRVADAVAQHCGITMDGRRDKAIFMMSLESVIDQGHCYARDYQLTRELEKHKFLFSIKKKVENELQEASKIWITKGGKIYPKRLLFAERFLAQALVDLNYSAKNYYDNMHTCSNEFSQLADEQKKAIFALEKSNLVILTGLPGTGKTRTVSAISKIYGEDNVLLCAPTGKAAKRITELCGMMAHTLHSILFFTELYNYKLEGDGCISNKLVIIDEASMMDIEIAGKLAIALDKTTCKLLIVGDICQLPSVGPGEVLKQIVESKIGIHCHLTQIRRQQPGSIIETAHAITNGKDIVKGKDEEVNTYFYGSKNIKDVIESIAKSNQWKDAQFLTVLRERGSDIANPIIQDVINPGNGQFRKGDKIIHLKNDKENNVMNGDTGVIRKVYSDGEFEAEYSENRFVNYPVRMQWMVGLSYAFTVHKSQGSEFNKVVFWLGRSRITTRNLFYTGVTRAKNKLLIIAEDNDIVYDAIDNIDKERQSSLKAYIGHFKKEQEKRDGVI